MLAGPVYVPGNVPKIEINGEKLGTPDAWTPEEEKGDVTMILESLNVDGGWNEKDIEGGNEKVENAIRPPYEI
jgi:hypothetical protein